MKAILTIILALALSSVAQAQLIYSALRIKVEPGVTCPATWTAQSETVVVAAEFRIRTPAILGGRVFFVTAAFVDLLWPSAQEKAAAIAQGTLLAKAESSSVQNYCALLPSP